jgi:hypothetical protein
MSNVVSLPKVVIVDRKYAEERSSGAGTTR